MAEVRICDLCGEPIKQYNGWYRYKYGVVMRYKYYFMGSAKPLEVCEDCIKQMIEMRKAAQAWKEQ